MRGHEQSNCAIYVSVVPLSIISACFSLQILLNTSFITARDFVSLEFVQCLRIQKIVVEVSFKSRHHLVAAVAMKDLLTRRSQEPPQNLSSKHTKNLILDFENRNNTLHIYNKFISEIHVPIGLKTH